MRGQGSDPQGREFLLGYNTSGFSRSHDIEKIIAWTAEAGFEAIEISFDPAHLMPDAARARLDAVREACQRVRLAVACGAGGRHALGPVPHAPAWVSSDPEERRVREAFLAASLAAAARLGSEVLVFHSGPRPAGVPEKTAWDRLREGLSRLIDLAGEEGVRLAIEFHPSMLVRD